MENSIKQFKKTLDATILSQLNDTQKTALLENAKTNPKDPINRKIIHVLEGYPDIVPDEITREGAEDLLNTFPVSISGAWPNDILTGIYTGNKDMVIKLHGTAPVYPSKYSLDILRAFPDLWDLYLKKLDHVQFFKNYSKNVRELWLKLNQDPDRHSAIGETCQRIEFLQPGTGIILKKMSDDVIEELFDENPNSDDTYYDAYDVYRIVPHNPGSRAERPTLMLFKMMWSITSVYQIVQQTSELVIDVLTGTLHKGIKSKKDQELIMVDGIRKDLKCVNSSWVQPPGTKYQQSVGFLVPNADHKLNKSDYYAICCQYVSIQEDTFGVLYDFLKTWPLSGLKSLLQKIIRFRASTISFSDGETLPTPVVLMVTCSVMIGHAGSFVPDIQRYVTGLESFTKRLVVTTLEDSASDDINMMNSLLAGSLLAQRVKMWKPSIELIKRWFGFAIEALKADRCFSYKLNDYKIINLRPYVIQEKCKPWHMLSALLDNLKSFELDLIMTRYIATYPDQPKIIGTNFPEVMPIWHCVDHHWAPSVAYFYKSSDYVHAQSETDTKPFAGLFSNIFKCVTGLNFRRDDDVMIYDKNEFFINTLQAQKQWYLSRFGQQKRRKCLKNTYKGTYTLDDSWLAGLVGPLDVGGQPSKIATMRTSDLYKIAVIKRPARDMKDSLLSQGQIDQGEKKAIQMLQRGLLLNKATLPTSDFDGATVILKNKYYLKINTNVIEWDKAKHIVFEIPLHPKAIDRPVSELLLSVGDGITDDGINSIKNLIRRLSPLTLARLVFYISTFQRRFEMMRISRDGGGTKLSANILDVDVFQTLAQIAYLAPGAIQYVYHLPGVFRVVNAPLWWHIRDQLKDVLYPIRNFENKWTKLYDHSGRKLWRHQKETIKDVINEHESLRRRGHFLWLKPGSGKTLIVLSYLSYLNEKGVLPSYVIYSLPSSAISTIASEAHHFSFDVDLLVPLVGKSKISLDRVHINQSRQPAEYKLTLIDHDHLRLCVDELLAIASQSVFIIDEVHKALNETKRTSVALEIAHNAYKFVAMTGTPVIDNKIYKLIGWFDQIVDFEVNERNFWVAANSMLAKNMETGIKVVDHSVSVIMLDQEERDYQSYVSPALGGKNANPSAKDHEMASLVSLKACEREMVIKTLSLVQEGRGVMLVAKDAKHVDGLYTMLLKHMNESEIYKMVGNASIHLTTKAVKDKDVKPYKVVIVPIKKAEGYTLTYLNAMVTSVYPSNNATREQIRGRIDRLDQERSEIDIYTYHAGVLTYILHHHEEARRLGIALAGYSK